MATKKKAAKKAATPKRATPKKVAPLKKINGTPQNKTAGASPGHHLPNAHQRAVGNYKTPFGHLAPIPPDAKKSTRLTVPAGVHALYIKPGFPLSEEIIKVLIELGCLPTVWPIPGADTIPGPEFSAKFIRDMRAYSASDQNKILVDIVTVSRERRVARKQDADRNKLQAVDHANECNEQIQALDLIASGMYERLKLG